MIDWGTSHFLGLLLIGAAVGLFLYLLSRWRYSSPIEVGPAMEAGACGSGVVAGVHLALGAWFPALLVHLVGASGNHIDRADLFVEAGNGLFKKADVILQIGEIHSLHIFLGGVATAILAGGGLWKFCAKPKPKKDREPIGETPLMFNVEPLG